jgi:hypothetical protein
MPVIFPSTNLFWKAKPYPLGVRPLVQGCHFGRLSGKSCPKNVVRMRLDERPSRPTVGRRPICLADGMNGRPVGRPRWTAPGGRPLAEGRPSWPWWTAMADGRGRGGGAKP